MKFFSVPFVTELRKNNKLCKLLKMFSTRTVVKLTLSGCCDVSNIRAYVAEFKKCNCNWYGWTDFWVWLWIWNGYWTYYSLMTSYILWIGDWVESAAMWHFTENIFKLTSFLNDSLKNERILQFLDCMFNFMDIRGEFGIYSYYFHSVDWNCLILSWNSFASFTKGTISVARERK